MATTTPNLGLTLPIGSEKVSRQILNGNFSLIDTAYGTLNSNITKHYIQIVAQSGFTLADSVKATLNQYPYFSSLSNGDFVTIAGGWLGIRTYTINFTKEDVYKFAGAVYDGADVYSFVFNSHQNSLTMEQLALNSNIANSQEEFTATNVHANVGELQYEVLKKNKSVGHIEVFLFVDTQIPGWEKVFDVSNGLNVLGDHNFTVVDYDNPSKAIWLYLHGDSLYTHDALPAGRYLVSETYMRNTSA